MNAPIVRLYGLVVLLFGLLVAFTSRWTVFEASSLRDNPANRRPLLEEQRIRRGAIRSADGVVLARSARAEGGVFRRRYPVAGLAAHAVGYSFTDLGRAGIERFRNDELTGERDDFGSILDQLRGKQQEGDDLVTTLDMRAQQVAQRALGANRGAVVALDPRSGAIRVMVSAPTFDPNGLDRGGRFAALNREQDSPLFNRATQAGYPPGSTFKVVTAAAALDSGRYTPSSRVDGRSPKDISGVPLTNFGGRDFGEIDLTTALTNSVNTVWAEVAEKLGRDRMAEYMQRFGFYSKPRLDYPSDQRKTSGEYGNGCGGRPLDPTSGRIDVGRMGIGQDKLCVTPLQMALVAAAVANGGELMRPRLTDRVVDRDGRTRDRLEPEVQERVMSEETASALAAMMANVVKEGTGTAAALEGIEVAGKTGTAEIDPARNVNQPWFIAFAPVRNPRIAIAVTVERSSGQGGTVAAPIAKQVLQALL